MDIAIVINFNLLFVIHYHHRIALPYSYLSYTMLEISSIAALEIISIIAIIRSTSFLIKIQHFFPIVNSYKFIIHPEEYIYLYLYICIQKISDNNKLLPSCMNIEKRDKANNHKTKTCNRSI